MGWGRNDYIIIGVCVFALIFLVCWARSRNRDIIEQSKLCTDSGGSLVKTIDDKILCLDVKEVKDGNP